MHPIISNHDTNTLIERVQRIPKRPSTSQPSPVQLPLWISKADERGIPNVIVRSPLFNARNRNQPRKYLREENLPILGDDEGTITYTGEELRQDDEVVWLQLIHLARELPPETMVEFKPYGFCRAIGWSLDGSSYKRLRRCLTRLQASSLQIYSCHLKEGIALSMLPFFEWKDSATGATLKRYRVKIASQLVRLFEGNYTKMEWEQRKKLPLGLATWLHGFYASHETPFHYRMEKLARGAGLTTCTPSRLRELFEDALKELRRKDIGCLSSSQIVNDCVYVTRVNKRSFACETNL